MHELMGASVSDNALRCCPTCGPIIDGVALSSCGSSWQAVTCFISFILLMNFVITSLFIGAFYETYVQVGSPDLSRVTLERLEEFRDAWMLLHRKAVADGRDENNPASIARLPRTHMLPSMMLQRLLLDLPQPLGISDSERVRYSRIKQIHLVSELAIPDRRGYMNFHEVLVRLAGRVAGVPVPQNDATRRIERAARSRPQLPPRSEGQSTRHIFIAVLIQSVWRGHTTRKLLTSARKRSYSQAPERPAPPARPSSSWRARASRASRSKSTTSPPRRISIGLVTSEH